MLHVDRTAEAELSASPARCLDVLAAVEEYPAWSGLIAAAEVTERAGDGSPERVRLRAELVGLGVELDCALSIGDDRAELRRLPNDAEDEERFDATWTLRPAAEHVVVSLHVEADVDAPGPVSLIGGRVARRLVDGLLADFAAAV